MEQPIASLDLPNNIIHKLQKNGIYYCKDLVENFDSIRHKINIPNWPSIAQAPVAKTALELLEEESQWQPITTFILELDALIKPEIVPNSITELTGLPGSGKTQVCFHLSLGVPEGATFFITNKNFTTNRLREIAQLYVPDVEAALQRIYCLEASDPAELLASVRFLENWLPDNDIRLLVIDSISWPVKQKPIAERTGLVYTVFQSLRVLANKYKFAIVVTNSLTTRVKNGQTYHTSSFGDSFQHAVNNRVVLSKENGSFKAQLVGRGQNGQREICFNFK